MQTGDLLFFAGHTPIDWAIRHLQGDTGFDALTHVALALSPHQVIEAVSPRVRTRLASSHEAALFVPMHCSSVQRIAVNQEAQKHFGEEYGIYDVLNFGAMLATGHQLPFRDQDSVWCSQLALLCLQAAGKLTELDPWHCSPASLARAVS